jgi:hypothetical protein
VEVGRDAGASGADAYLRELIAVCVANARGERRFESSSDAAYFNRIADMSNGWGRTEMGGKLGIVAPSEC